MLEIRDAEKSIPDPGVKMRRSTTLFIWDRVQAWRAGTSNRIAVHLQARQAENRFLGSFEDLQFRAQ
jgi:hypothetical protein